MIQILAVDDEPALLRTLELNLGNRGYAVSTAGTGAAAIKQVSHRRPDLIILDLGLPDLDGLDVIERVHRLHPGLPILVLSARTGGADQAAARNLGAADYLTKPFSIAELLTRTRALTRGAGRLGSSSLITLGRLTVDLAAREIQPTDPAAEPIHLSQAEWRILEALLRRPGAVVSRPELVKAMRGDRDADERNFLGIYLQQLRRKLEPDPQRPRHLIAEPGGSFRFAP